MEAPDGEPKWWWPTLLVVAGLAAAARLLLAPASVDDAYITYRYAVNVAAGLGLVYNPGEAVLGTTSPLWAVLLAAGARLGTPPHAAGPLLASLAGGGLTALVGVTARRMGATPFVAVLASLLWAGDPLAARVERGGMETSLFCCLALGALLVASSRAAWGRVASGVLAAFATLARPEGVLVVALVLIAGTRGRQRWLALAGCVVPLLPWAAFATIHYGSLIPSSVLAKFAVYGRSHAVDTLRLFAFDAGMFLLHTPLLLAAKVVASLAALVALVIAARTPAGRLVALFTLAYAAAYVFASPQLFLWYQVPLGPGVVAATMALASRGLTGLRSGTAGILLVCAVGVILFSGSKFVGFSPTGRLNVQIETCDREPRYAAVAAWLASHLAPGMVVAAPEIGVLGYELPNTRILDTVGLVSPSALPFARGLRGTMSPQMLIALRPEVVVVPDAYAGGVLSDHAVSEAYSEICLLPGSARLGRKIHVLRLVRP